MLMKRSTNTASRISGVIALSMAALGPMPAHASLGNQLVSGVHSHLQHLAYAVGHAGHVIERGAVRGAHHVAHFTSHAAHTVAKKTTHTARQIKADVK